MDLQPKIITNVPVVKTVFVAAPYATAALSAAAKGKCAWADEESDDEEMVQIENEGRVLQDAKRQLNIA
jgi:hypothetical protein